MSQSKARCLACSNYMSVRNAPVVCEWDGQRVSVPATYYKCLSCGKCFVSADEVGTRATVCTTTNVPIVVVRGLPFHERLSGYSSEELAKAEHEYWENVKF